MQLNYDITHTILKLTSSISTKLGEAQSSYSFKPLPELRYEYMVQSLFATLQLEDSEIREEQVERLIRNQKIALEPAHQKLAKNIRSVHQNLREYEAYSKRSFLLLHQHTMQGLSIEAGRLRRNNVIYGKGEIATHLSPAPHLLDFLFKESFNFQVNSTEIPIIKACIFFYEMYANQPFQDGNGIVSRLWWKRLLMEHFSVFEFLPLEKAVLESQESFYHTLSKCGKSGRPTEFLEYLLGIINDTITEYLRRNKEIKTANDRLRYFVSENVSSFSRKDYMEIFNSISTATASRDLKLGVEKGLFKKEGDKRRTVYKLPKETSLVMLSLNT